jgi:hypothetical protein
MVMAVQEGARSHTVNALRTSFASAIVQALKGRWFLQARPNGAKSNEGQTAC